MRIAIVGSGIAGLAASLELQKQGHDFTLFEAQDYLGGHVRTVSVPLNHDPDPVLVDLGVFMHEPRCLHPAMAELAKTLGVPTHPFSLSVSIVHQQEGIDYSGAMDPKRTWWQGLVELAKAFVGEVKSFPRLPSTRLLLDIHRLYQEIPLLQKESILSSWTLRDYVDRYPKSQALLEAWLIPSLFCWWGIPREKAMDCSLSVILDSLYRTPQNEQYLFTNGWASFTQAIAQPFQDKVRLLCPVHTLAPHDKGVRVGFADRQEPYDGVILAIPPNRCLDILPKALAEARAILQRFTTSTTTVYLHRDSRWAPPIHRRSILNLINNDLGSYTTLWSGGLDPRKPPIFVTWGDPLAESIRSEDLIEKVGWNRTLPSIEFAQSSRQIQQVQGHNRIWFCGAHVHALEDGFPPSLWHENALVSGQKAARSLMKALSD